MAPANLSSNVPSPDSWGLSTRYILAGEVVLLLCLMAFFISHQPPSAEVRIVLNHQSILQGWRTTVELQQQEEGVDPVLYADILAAIDVALVVIRRWEPVAHRINYRPLAYWAATMQRRALMTLTGGFSATAPVHQWRPPWKRGGGESAAFRYLDYSWYMQTPKPRLLLGLPLQSDSGSHPILDSLAILLLKTQFGAGVPSSA
ncbi:hypothetical protein EIP91_001404 [Steccherinum ochraceum]|uniref:Uncharacterized protein n=1 Tax=Steccherinum ochraceum TaxID=92696 RepID=A0A4R0RHZ1_9APHY|nr:hypothetical protein EIP91_001404 [Steccherinum ochraceum]